MPTIDYGQVFCDAVKSIIDGEVAKLEFDISRECTIVKIVDKAYGEYQVSDGSMTFTAIANEGAHFEVGDRVMVTIPKGDYNKQISILTKIVDVWSGPAGFVRPLDTIIQCTDNVAITASKGELVANSALKSVELLYLKDQRFFDFQKIGISAKFKTLLSNLNIVEGTYGLRFSLIELDKKAEERKEKAVKQFVFSSKDMLGNPYEFSTYFTQEYAFDIPEGFDIIHEIKVEFYQEGNFKDGNDNLLPVIAKNLFVDKLEIYFGYDINKSFKEFVTIRSDNSSYNNTTSLPIELLWIHKISENKLQEIDKSFLEAGAGDYGVRWYKYVSGCAEENTDSYGGDNWFLLNPPETESEDLAGPWPANFSFTSLNPETPDDFPCSIYGPVSIANKEEKYKAVCLIKTRPLINDETYVVIERWTSNILTLENTNIETAGGEAARDVVRKDLSLMFSDNSFGNYFVYDQNGEILDIKESDSTRTIQLCYQGAEINADNPLDITKIEWSLPKEENSMITYDEDQHKNEAADLKTFEYEILDTLETGRADNTIQCSVYISGQLYTTLTETLRFGKQGSNGTTTTFLLEMMDGKNALPLTHYIKNPTITEENFKNYDLYIKSGEKTYTPLAEDANFNAETDYYEKIENLRVQAILIKDTGKRIYFTEDQKKKIKWSLLNKHENIELDADTTDVVTLKLTSSDEIPVPDNNYTILRAAYQYEDSGPTLMAYLPIPIRAPECEYIVGATEILYNHQGTPKYNNGAYTGFGKDNTIIYKTWEVKQPTIEINGEQVINNPNPVNLIEIDEEEVGLQAPILYSKGSKKDSQQNLLEIQDEICVYCTNDGKIIWSQPVLIMQSQYDFAMLNAWDGSLTIDEKNGTILSTMLGAGRKDDQNRFSGVLIGDLQGGTDLEATETMTGVYGLQNGIITYGLRENGTAFFGAHDNGRIEIDGTSGIIRSAGWEKDDNGNWSLSDTANAGTFIDLTDGKLLMEADNNYFKFQDGTLEMSLNGANIKLTNHNEDNLEDYIDATISLTASGIETTISNLDNKLSSQILQTENLINNCVQNTQTGKSFNWSLKSNGFYLNTGTYADADNYIFSCDENGIKIGGQGIISSGRTDEDDNAIMTINLDEGNISAANFTLASDNVSITQEYVEVKGLFGVGDNTYMKTSNYKVSSDGNSGPGYYYREIKAVKGGIVARDFTTGEMLGKNTYNTDKGTIYYAECLSNGTYIKESIPKKGYKGYRIHTIKQQPSWSGYVALTYDGDNVFENGSSTVYGGPSGSVTYDGSSLDLTSGQLVLNCAQGCIVIGGSEAPIMYKPSGGTTFLTLGSSWS